MAELIAKTASAVAVDEDLTVLIDWVNIEQVSAFTVVVDNAGGGSANDIADVQIDTSSDGGDTSDLDQHAGVPAVPVASAKASLGTFTESAAFVRIRAKCAAGEDTTARAVLFADSSVARICTLADVKERLGLTDTDHDSVIGRIITGIERIFSGYCRRELIVTASDVTEYYGGGASLLALRRYPVVTVTSATVAYDYDFDSAIPLTPNSDYRVISGSKKGIVSRIYTIWPKAHDSIQVIYRGGYCAAGQAPAAGEYAMPADLREAAIEQASFIFKRRDDIGLSAVGFQGGNVSKFSAMKLLPMVEEILKIYRSPEI